MLGFRVRVRVGVLSRGDIVQGDIVQGGYCPGGYCPGGCCPGDIVLEPNKNTFTRGNRFKLSPSNNYNKIHDNFFTNRVINIWNSLPDNVVCAKTTNAFKNLGSTKKLLPKMKIIITSC